MPEQNGIFREWSKRYLLEYLIALALCIAAAGFCISLARVATINANRVLLMAVPAGAILLMAFVVLRHFLRIDEFLRRIMVESFAVEVPSRAYGLWYTPCLNLQDFQESRSGGFGAA